MGNYELEFQTLDLLEREIEEKINDEIDDFMSQEHLTKFIIPDKDLLVQTYIHNIMFKIKEEIEEIFENEVDDLITDINDSFETIDSDKDVWDSAANEEVWDVELESDIEDLVSELDEVEKRFQERKQQGISEHEKTKIDWGPEWEGF